MLLDSITSRCLIKNLSKCIIIRPDISCINQLLCRNYPRNYSTQNIAHSTPTPFNKHIDMESSSIYINPVCMQMDQLLYTCANHDQLLNLLVTHRGAMYLHNLITVMNILREFVKNQDNKTYKPDCDDLILGYKRVFEKNDTTPKQELDLSRFSKSEIEIINKAQSQLMCHFEDPKNQEYLEVFNHSRDLRDAIIRDERYDLLLQDLYVNKNKLDLSSICNVIITLDALEHRYYRLYNGLLKRLMSLEISFSDQPPKFINDIGLLLLKTCQCYAKSGFYDIPLYNKVTNELFRANFLTTLGNSEKEQLVSHIIRLYSLVKSYDFTTFYKISDTIDKVTLSPKDFTCLAVAFSNHLNFHKINDRVLYNAAKKIQEDHKNFTTLQLCTCLSSFSKMRLYFRDVWNICSNRLIDEIDVSISGFYDINLEINTLCKTVHDIVSIDNSSHLVRTLIDKVSLYLEHHIDEIDEESSINIAFSIFSTGTNHEPNLVKSDNQFNVSKQQNDDSNFSTEDIHTLTTNLESSSGINNYLLPYILRRIGSDVFWEKHPLKVFSAWLFHILVIPEIKHNIHKRCILPCFRQWLLCYFTRHEIHDEVSKIINNLSSKFKIYSKFDAVEPFKKLMETPIPIDLLVLDDVFGNKVINIVECCVRNKRNRPMGVDLLIKVILEHFGLDIHVIDFNLWTSLDTSERTELLASIITNEYY